MKSSICIINRKQTASFSIVGLMLATAPLWLMLAAANTSLHAQTSDAVSSSTAATPSPADWTQFLRDNMERYNPYETVLGVNNVGGLKLQWTFTTGNCVISSPAVVAGVVYLGSCDHNVYALNASTGAKRWSFTTGGQVLSSPAVANGVVYIGSEDGNMYALDASTGEKLWSFAFGTGTQSSAAVVDGVVYVGSGVPSVPPATSLGNVYALNARTGAKLWSFATGNAVISSPAVMDGVVYIGSFDDNVYALNASTGAKLWSYPIGNFVYSSPAVANGVVYIGDDVGYVYALNASTGALLWRFATAKPGTDGVFSPPAVANGVVYVSAEEVWALNASTGAVLWVANEPREPYSSPAVANGVVYIGVGNDERTMYALNASTGAILWSHITSDYPGSSLAVMDGVIYGSSGNNVFAFGLGTVEGGANLFLRIRPTPETVHQGDLLTYAFPVWNLGPGNALHEVLTTQVPAGTTFDYIRISGTPGLGTCTTPPYEGTGEIVCDENSSMAPNTTWTVRLTVKVTAPVGTVITESAATLADTPDPNMANNTATVSIKVQ